MTDSNPYRAPSRITPGTHQRGADKLSRIPIKVITTAAVLKKPSWIRAKIQSGRNITNLKKILRDNKLVTVCEEANCPNLGECFNNGTATFMIMGDICTRRCPFCDVAHGRPGALDPQEPIRLARTVKAMNLSYVVVTSVDRDDLPDGGSSHFADCIRDLRKLNPELKVEILVPDFRGRMEIAIRTLTETPPDVFNHNLETVPRLYKQVRPGANYAHSLQLLERFKSIQIDVITKSGLMLGLGETLDEVISVMKDLCDHGCEMLTLGQYLQPSRDHLPVFRYLTPAEFKELAALGNRMGFSHIASGPMVRSSYHADIQAASTITHF